MIKFVAEAADHGDWLTSEAEGGVKRQVQVSPAMAGFGCHIMVENSIVTQPFYVVAPFCFPDHQPHVGK